MTDLVASFDSIVFSPRLPSLPAVAIKVLEITRDQSADLSELVGVIENDQAICAKVLRIVNSSYYGLARTCTSIRQALTLLGMSAVRTIVLGFSLVDSIDGRGDDVGFDFLTYWRRGLYTATASRELARRSGACDGDEAFLGGLLQDIGMVAMTRALGDRYLQAVDLNRGCHGELPATEEQAFGFTHAAVGAAIAARWELPPALVEAIRFHHTPGDADEGHRVLAEVVAAGNHVAAVLSEEASAATYQRMREQCGQRFGFSESDCQVIFSEIADKTTELASLFEIRIGEKPIVDEVLSRAEEQLIAGHLQAAPRGDPTSSAR